MPKLFIPTIGTELTLATDWEFVLYKDPLNATLVALLEGSPTLSAPRPLGATQCYTARLPAGAVLQVDRVHIRKGVGAVNSISFCLKGAKARVDLKSARYNLSTVAADNRKVTRAVHFWVKLEEAHNIDFI